MSVRFFRIFFIVLLAHFLALQVVWVGFSAPAPRPPAIFTYAGALAALDSEVSQGAWPSPEGGIKPVKDGFEGTYAGHWLEIRGPSK